MVARLGKCPKIIVFAFFVFFHIDTTYIKLDWNSDNFLIFWCTLMLMIKIIMVLMHIERTCTSRYQTGTVQTTLASAPPLRRELLWLAPPSSGNCCHDRGRSKETVTNKQIVKITKIEKFCFPATESALKYGESKSFATVRRAFATRFHVKSPRKVTHRKAL